RMMTILGGMERCALSVAGPVARASTPVRTKPTSHTKDLVMQPPVVRRNQRVERWTSTGAVEMHQPRIESDRVRETRSPRAAGGNYPIRPQPTLRVSRIRLSSLIT